MVAARTEIFHEIRVGIDVVSGVHGETNRQMNAHFLGLVHRFTPAWSLSKTTALRNLMIEEICKIIESNSGRFIHFKSGLELTNKASRQKVRRALNDAKDRLNGKVTKMTPALAPESRRPTKNMKHENKTKTDTQATNTTVHQSVIVVSTDDTISRLPQSCHIIHEPKSHPD